jgi:hypothetical protein
MRILTSLILAFTTIVSAGEQVPLQHHARPNIVIVLTDDQDLHMNSISYMPLLKKHVIDQGTYYKRHYCTTAICCPSRVSLWTGRNAHNTNVTDVNPPYGGYPKFVAQLVHYSISPFAPGEHDIYFAGLGPMLGLLIKCVTLCKISMGIIQVDQPKTHNFMFQ